MGAGVVLAGRALHWHQGHALHALPATVLAAPPRAQAAKQLKKRDWQRRGSSGNWIADRITWKEEVAYKQAMGYL